MNQETRDDFGDALGWALETTDEPAMASANWLAVDIDPSRSSVVALFTEDGVSLDALRRAKDAFKTMRIVGETPRDRRTGARLYAAALAAALVRYETRISRQSNAAMHRAFQGLLEDREMPVPLRDLAGRAQRALYDLEIDGGDDAGDGAG